MPAYTFEGLAHQLKLCLPTNPDEFFLGEALTKLAGIRGVQVLAYTFEGLAHN